MTMENEKKNVESPDHLFGACNFIPFLFVVVGGSKGNDCATGSIFCTLCWLSLSFLLPNEPMEKSKKRRVGIERLNAYTPAQKVEVEL